MSTTQQASAAPARATGSTGFHGPVVLGPTDGTHLNVLGEQLTLLVSGDQTNGAFTEFSATSPQGGGTPLHTHHNEDDAFYVVEGVFEIQCGDHKVRAEA